MAQNVMLVIGLIYLVGLAASHYLLQSVSETTLWWAWLVLFIVTWVGMSKAMKKQSSKEMQGAWTIALVLGVVLTGVQLLGVIPFNGASLLGIWLLLSGGPLFAGGYDRKMSSWVALGLVYVAFGLVTPAWFPNSYFLIGALLLGLPMVVGGAVRK